MRDRRILGICGGLLEVQRWIWLINGKAQTLNYKPAFES
jgi:hypothetical protein